jgi:heme oxygenase
MKREYKMIQIALSNSPSLREKLKIQTKPFHDSIESTALARSLSDGTISISDYSKYLQRLLALHTDIENQLQHFTEWDEFGIDITKRLRSNLLQQDLASLQGHDTDNYSPPVFNLQWSFPVAVGVLYVLEGSTMGGQVLVQRLSHLCGIDGMPSVRYFNAYGNQTMISWKYYCSFLDDFESHFPESVEEVITAACETFTLMHKVLDEKN